MKRDRGIVIDRNVTPPATKQCPHFALHAECERLYNVLKADPLLDASPWSRTPVSDNKAGRRIGRSLQGVCTRRWRSRDMRAHVQFRVAESQLYFRVVRDD
jgi:hypothetical protein